MNFYQAFSLIQLGSSVLKLENVQNGSLYVSQSMGQSMMAGEQGEQNYAIFFGKVLDTAKIQQEMINRQSKGQLDD